jgi:hypothetical protein
MKIAAAIIALTMVLLALAASAGRDRKPDVLVFVLGCGEAPAEILTLEADVPTPHPGGPLLVPAGACLSLPQEFADRLLYRCPDRTEPSPTTVRCTEGCPVCASTWKWSTRSELSTN